MLVRSDMIRVGVTFTLEDEEQTRAGRAVREQLKRTGGTSHRQPVFLIPSLIGTRLIGKRLHTKTVACPIDGTCVCKQMLDWYTLFLSSSVALRENSYCT